MSLFIKQAFTLRLDTKKDITGATVSRIRYQKKNGVKGFWEATIEGQKLRYDVSNTDIDIPGVWEMQAYVEKDGKIKKGNKVKIEFKSDIL